MQKVKARFSFFKRVYCDLGGVPTPYSAGRPVRCELVNASFAEKRSYQELSYAWGSLRMASSRSTLTSIHFKLASIYLRLWKPFARHTCLTGISRSTASASTKLIIKKKALRFNGWEELTVKQAIFLFG
jgi:hypothetical protein